MALGLFFILLHHIICKYLDSPSPHHRETCIPILRKPEVKMLLMPSVVWWVKESCVFFPGCPVSPWKEPIQTRAAREAFVSLLSLAGPFRYCGDSKEWEWGVQGLIPGRQERDHEVQPLPCTQAVQGLPQGYLGAGGISHPPDHIGRPRNSKAQASCVYIFRHLNKYLL